MPKRDDIRHVLVIGSGPIQIGQACEFDYSGTQACRVLREEGIRVTLVNSNPATIMTDPEFADATYVEPITTEVIEQIIAREKPDALLPTLGGQTALNAAVGLHEAGILEKYGVELIGANMDAIQRGEDRQQFKDVVLKVGGEVPRSAVCHTMDEVRSTVEKLGLPVVIRPSFTMGGLGSGMAYDWDDVERIAGNGLAESPTTEVLIEESVLGWKEYELELMRDRNDNVVVVCSIENVDPMGVHTGDSVTVAPSMTLTDREYQHMRDIGIAVLREVGVDTGGCNIQFAIDPADGRMIVIEMNPRVSRSSALASKATGFPIAKIAAKLAIGYTLDEIPNDITKATPAAFEPALDYVVVKVPRFTFEKFPGADPTLTTTMKSVGEAMSLGRTFQQALQKALRSTETKAAGFWTRPDPGGATLESTMEALTTAHDGTLYTVERALRLGATVDEVHAACKIDPWFVDQVAQLVDLRAEIADAQVVDADLLRRAKRAGCSDAQIAALRPELAGEDGVRRLRHRLGLRPVYKTVDTCAAEFEAHTPYHYSTYEDETEVAPSTRAKVIILGSGPNRIGQGIEFDYSCVHAVQALRQAGYETIMVNCNPETVSTDYDTSDRLYFEPLTEEDVIEILTTEKENGTLHGVIVQFGGQTPLKLASAVERAGVPILGTQPEKIDLAEDRDQFMKLLNKLDLTQPKNGIAYSLEQARLVADGLGFPMVIRPSNVLGGRAMIICQSAEEFERYVQSTLTELVPPDIRQKYPNDKTGQINSVLAANPLLFDSYLQGAVEIDVDCLSDGSDVFVAGIMEHIEEAGIHSGDSACSLPPHSLSADIIAELKRQATGLAKALNVGGLMNVQFALKDNTLYVLEVNPRASRTVPFVAKVIGAPVAKIAARIMAGEKLAAFDLKEREIKHIGIKEAVFPFARFPGVDTVLGPEMKSTGEVIGLDTDFAIAFAKSQLGASVKVPKEGTVFISVRDSDKAAIVDAVRDLANAGFRVIATGGTQRYLVEQGIDCIKINKVLEGRPHIVDAIKNGEVQLVINTTDGAKAVSDSRDIRRAALMAKVPYYTTIPGANAAVEGILAYRGGNLTVKALQEYFAA
jgi:carbamoyl-phosphate synthase large subunit